MDAGEKALRLDKWLWYARFFKTRGLATKVIAGGRLRLDGEVMTKPHRAALVGQVLTFAQGSRVRVIRIMALGSRRGPADEASLLYDDLAPLEPKKADDAPKEVNFEERLRGSGRPTKRERRQTDKLKPGH